MVRLDRITTRTGDDGTTGLADGSRLPKDHPIIEALGAVDELNSLLGMVRTCQLPEAAACELPAIQNDLFDLGADIATPRELAHTVRVREAQVRRLESMIDTVNPKLAPLVSFVLPGGSPASAWLHLARTAARRAERMVIAAEHVDSERAWNPDVRRYLNRLSDLCFVWARLANGDGRSEVLWRPGAAPR